QRAVFLDAGLKVEDHAPAVRGRLQRLRSRLYPFHRPPAELGRSGNKPVLGVGTNFAAETATDVRRDDPHPGFGQAHRSGDEETDEMRVLARHPDRQRAVPSRVFRKHAAWLHGGWRQALLEDALLDDD